MPASRAASRCSGEAASGTSSRSSATAQPATISTVASGWNCTPRCGPSRNACGASAVRASSVAPGGVQKRSKCHSSHGPSGTTEASSVSTTRQPSSGTGAGPTSAPSTAASTWPP